MLRIIPAQTGIGFKIKSGQLLRVVDYEGGQVCDLMAYSLDGKDRLNNGRTFDYNSKIQPVLGDSLWSDYSKRMMTIVADEVGKHDFLYSTCSVEMFNIQYGIEGYHPNCTDNITNALKTLGIDSGPLPVPFNIFQNVSIENGNLIIHKPASRKGDAIVLKAEMDLAIALSACSASVCSGGECTSIAFEVLDSE